MPVGAVDGADTRGSQDKARASGLPARRFPVRLELLPDVAGKIAGEAEDIAEDMVGDDVGIEPAHIGELAGVVHQRREHVVLQAGGGRLHPTQAARRRQQRGRELSEKGVGFGDLPHGRFLPGGVSPPTWARRPPRSCGAVPIQPPEKSASS